MTDDFAERTYSFRWFIENPFVPFRRMEATFLSGSPIIPNSWKVVLIPDPPGEITSWTFMFRLKCIPVEHYIVSAGRIDVRMTTNTENWQETVVHNFSFERRNRYTYEFPATVWTYPRLLRSPYLIIKVTMTFFEQNIANQEWPTFDLMQLSEDLRTLFTSSFHSDLTLTSKEAPFRRYPVHSYIIQARWCNFFRVHTANQIINNLVELNMSREVLSEILTYVYTGTLHIGEDFWGEPSFGTELFQMIDRYDLHHLYNVFARTDLPQFRQTKKHMIRQAIDFLLEDDYNRPLHDPVYVWHVLPNTAYYLFFKIKFFWREYAPWCLYSLQSGSRHRIHAQVGLEFRIQRREPYGNLRPPLPYLMHRKVYDIPPFETTESGTCSLKVREPFRDFLAGESRGRRVMRIEHVIRCILYLSDGTQVIQILNEDDVGYLDEEKRLNILSDDMYGLFAFPSPRNDMFFNCPVEMPNTPNALFYHYKGLFVTRVPGWRAILGNLEEGNEIPLVNEIRMRRDAFQLILYYICTGKVFRLPVSYLEEIGDFAQRGGLTGLENLLGRLRVAAQNM